MRASQSFEIDVLDVNDFDPEFDETSYSCTLAENVATNTECDQARATDGDGTGNEVSYRLTGSGTELFTISSTGVITLTGQLDREDEVRCLSVVER